MGEDCYPKLPCKSVTHTSDQPSESAVSASLHFHSAVPLFCYAPVPLAEVFVSMHHDQQIKQIFPLCLLFPFSLGLT